VLVGVEPAGSVAAAAVPLATVGWVPPGSGVVAPVPWQVPQAAVEEAPVQLTARLLPFLKLPWQ
jgi:hypothetical protein